METYKKIHETLEIANIHIAKIKERNGNCILSKNGSKYLVEYAFYDKKNYRISNEKIFRGANKGIKKQSAGSFYTNDSDLAEQYSEMEDNPKIYAYNLPNIILIDVYDLEDADEDAGIKRISDAELILYDGYFAKSGIQICLFGRISNESKLDNFNDKTKAIFEKPSISEIRKDSFAIHRRYDR